MKKIFIILIFSAFFNAGVTEAASIKTIPEDPIQGEPLMVQIDEVNGIDDVAKIIWNKKSLWFYTYDDNPFDSAQGKPTALIAIDLNQKSGDYKIEVKLENKTTLEKIVTINQREKIEELLGIPAKLGGNTPQAATNLVTNLTKENAVINSVYSATKRFWSKKFIYPITDPIVTDSYGYLRKTGYYTIPHKGTDFRASEGTSVLAMNRGVVRLAIESKIYGKTIAIDHGFGVVTYYMHLSKIFVSQGELVKKGQAIGLSGQTGYAEVPHLHLSVKINGISIDPITFINLFNN